MYYNTLKQIFSVKKYTVIMGATERIVEFLDYKGITKYKFCKDLGFSNKFLDNSSNMGTDKACKILHYFPEINPEWLLTGKEPMLREPHTAKDPDRELSHKYYDLLEKSVALHEENKRLLALVHKGAKEVVNSPKLYQVAEHNPERLVEPKKKLTEK